MIERGPFNLVFHGIQPDWIEEEMADDREFKRDVLEQRVRSIIRDQVQCSKCVKKSSKNYRPGQAYLQIVTLSKFGNFGNL